MAALRAAEIELLITANDSDLARADKNVKSTGERIEKKPIVAKVNADEKDALAGMDRVEEAAKRIVSEKTLATVDAKIDGAEKQLGRVTDRLEYLRTVETELDVGADISRAEAQLQRVERSLDGLRKIRTTIDVDADTSAATDALEDVQDDAGGAGEDAGKAFGDNIVAALATIPIAGAVIGIGVAAGKALVDGLNDGMQIQVGYDRLEGLTGISAADALRLGRAAGEAYANTFGESIEANMDTTRLALQFDIIDENATTRDAQKVVQGLAGIADVLGEDVRPVATAVTTLLQTGLARTADDAFDLIATGAREGVNRFEDLLDTLTEYPAVFARLGISGEESLGLINQSMQAGARNSDLAADALKEFQIRATDSSTLSAQGFELIGLSAEEMTAKIAAGGEGAREGLDIVLDRLRSMEDPVARNAAAVALFGTKAEDLGEALFAMDLSTAVDQLNGVQGAAQRMFDTLASNDATKIEQAQRNIEVAVQGIQGALAAVFSEPLGDFADWVSQNRGPVLQFFLDVANGALDVGESMVEGAAAGTEAFGGLVSGPLADAAEGLASIMRWLGQNDAADGIQEMVDGMRGFDEQTSTAADNMREVLGQALDTARGKLNEFGEGAVALGYLNDASLRLADALSAVGVNADGSVVSLEGVDIANLSATESGAALEAQVRNAIAALGEQISAADATGESQATLTDRYNSATSALVGQLTQMGLTEEQARALIDTVLQTPASATTAFGSNAPEEQSKVQGLADRITTLPDGTVVVNAATEQAEADVNYTARDRESTIYVTTRGRDGGGHFAAGGPIHGPGGPRDDLVPILASNGEHMITAEEVNAAGGHGEILRLRRALLRGDLRYAEGGPILRSVPSSTWRVTGDQPQAFTVTAGGVTPTLVDRTKPAIQLVDNGTYYSYDPHAISRDREERLTRVLDTLPPL